MTNRKGRRRILNEQALVEALQEIIPTDLLEFSGMTFEEQVELSLTEIHWTLTAIIQTENMHLGRLKLFRSIRFSQLWMALAWWTQCIFQNTQLPSKWCLIEPDSTLCNMEHCWSIAVRTWSGWTSTSISTTKRHVRSLPNETFTCFSSKESDSVLALDDKYNNNADTEVKIDEFERVVVEAIEMSKKSYENSQLHSEL